MQEGQFGFTAQLWDSHSCRNVLCYSNNSCGVLLNSMFTTPINIHLLPLAKIEKESEKKVEETICQSAWEEVWCRIIQRGVGWVFNMPRWILRNQYQPFQAHGYPSTLQHQASISQRVYQSVAKAERRVPIMQESNNLRSMHQPKAELRRKRSEWNPKRR